MKIIKYRIKFSDKDGCNDGREDNKQPHHNPRDFLLFRVLVEPLRDEAVEVRGERDCDEWEVVGQIDDREEQDRKLDNIRDHRCLAFAPAAVSARVALPVQHNKRIGVSETHAGK